MLANWGMQVEKGLMILCDPASREPGGLTGQGIESLPRPRSTFNVSQGFDWIP